VADLGFTFIGFAAGIAVGALAAYGAMFLWAIKTGRDEEGHDRFH
jgi:nitrogen fixation-related uncharacterized protein